MQVDEFKNRVIDCLARIEVQLDHNTRVLEKHEQRSEDLHKRLIPLEENAVFFKKLAALIGILATIAAGARYLLLK